MDKEEYTDCCKTVTDSLRRGGRQYSICRRCIGCVDARDDCVYCIHYIEYDKFDDAMKQEVEE